MNTAKKMSLLGCAIFIFCLIPVNITKGSLVGDTVDVRIGNYYATAHHSQYVVGPSVEYAETIYDMLPVFIINRSVDISEDTITTHQQVEYTGIGGGVVYNMILWISDLDWIGSPDTYISGVQVIGSSNSTLIDFGPDWVVFVQLITIPEPATMGLLLLGGLAVLRRKR